MTYHVRWRQRRPLPRLAALAKPDPAEAAMLDAMDRVDRLVAGAPESSAVAFAIADTYDTTPERVVRLANDTELTPGETALVLAIARQTHARFATIARDAERRSWYAVAREKGASPQRLVADLRHVVRQASGPPSGATMELDRRRGRRVGDARRP
jgi:hypothetical protein